MIVASELVYTITCRVEQLIIELAPFPISPKKPLMVVPMKRPMYPPLSIELKSLKKARKNNLATTAKIPPPKNIEEDTKIVVESSKNGGAAGTLIEIAHGSVVDVSNFEVAKKTPKVKGRFGDNLSTAYTRDPLDTERSNSAMKTFDMVKKSVDVPRLGLSITTTKKLDATLNEALVGSDMAVTCPLSYKIV